ncbi:MAG: hypothetical protein IT276_08805 [Ignavibacteriaceae bacterium]|nr:hypothetical protein [Ignavibacterium sp.]MCC6255000.1 hypothetical protein [Ignavibacteriaceae bacterium]HRN26430.1 hypothetical protein [Ignavibacteriaceae bacterium]HRQ53965.1 hypothetical protein [Ignavibacteriaceae bacterium]
MFWILKSVLVSILRAFSKNSLARYFTPPRKYYYWGVKNANVIFVPAFFTAV